MRYAIPFPLDRGYPQFVVILLVVGLLEVVGYKGTLYLFDALPDLRAFSPEVATVEPLQSIFRLTVGFGFIWLLLFGNELYLERTRFLSKIDSTASIKGYLLLHLLALVTFCSIRFQMLGYRLIAGDIGVASLVIASGVGFALLVTSALRLLGPFDFWLTYLRQHRQRLAFFAMAFAVLAVATTLGARLDYLERACFGMLFSATMVVIGILLQWLGYQVRVDVDNSTLIANGFDVKILSPCLGYEGMTIGIVMLSLYLWVNRERFHFPAAWLLFPVLVAIQFVANAFRLTILAAIGASWSPSVAIYGFHTASGWVILLLVLALVIFALEGYSFFSKKPTSFTLDLSAENIGLLPQVVLIAVALLSLLVSPGFEWLYPLRVIVVGALLRIIWPQLNLERISRMALPTFVGIGVFALWIAIVQDDPAISERFAKTLFSAPSWLVAGWLLFRVVGAVLVVPLAEELAFRGALWRLTEKELGSRGLIRGPHAGSLVTLVVTSIAFGFLHSAWVAGILAGLSYGILRLYRNRLTDAVVAHGVTNLLLAVYVMSFHSWSLW